MKYYGERVIGMGILLFIMFLSDTILFMFNLQKSPITVKVMPIQQSIVE